MSKDKDVEGKIKQVAEATNKALDGMDAKMAESAAKVDKMAESQKETKKEIKAQGADLVELKEGIAGITEALKGFTGKYKDVKSTGEMDAGQSGTAEAVEVNGESEILTAGESYLASPELSGKAELLRFMEEYVTIEVNTTAQEDADPVIEAEVNGRKDFFVRGIPKKTKRKFVEVLARAKPIAYQQKHETDKNGDKTIVWPTTRGSRYPFSVLEDTQRGRQWLKEVMQQA